jgi:hypothetical protein
VVHVPQPIRGPARRRSSSSLFWRFPRSRFAPFAGIAAEFLISSCWVTKRNIALALDGARPWGIRLVARRNAAPLLIARIACPERQWFKCPVCHATFCCSCLSQFTTKAGEKRESHRRLLSTFLLRESRDMAWPWLRLEARTFARCPIVSRLLLRPSPVNTTFKQFKFLLWTIPLSIVDDHWKRPPPTVPLKNAFESSSRSSSGLLSFSLVGSTT